MLCVFSAALAQPAQADGETPNFAPDVLGTRALAASAHPYRDRWDQLRDIGVPDDLAALIEPVRHADRFRQADLVNRLVHSFIRYREDADMWGRADYWANPRESWARRAGDCEDLAILKRAALRHIGVPDEDMFLLVGRRQDGSDHALLALRTNDGWLYLDDRQTPDRGRAAKGFVPMFSMTGSAGWLHGRDSDDLRPAAR